MQDAESRAEAAEEREREMARERERERLLLRQEIDFSRARAGELEGREGEFRKQVDAVRRQCEEVRVDVVFGGVVVGGSGCILIG